MPKKPTARQRKAVDLTIENIRKPTKSQGQILKEAEYSESVTLHPDLVTKSKGFLQLLEERMPDDLLTKVHLEGLNADRKILKNNNKTGEIEEVGSQPDYAVRHKYLDTAYKLKNRYTDGEKTINILVYNDEQAKLIAARALRAREAGCKE